MFYVHTFTSRASSSLLLIIHKKMPIGEVMVGAALGITLQVLHEAIMKAKDRSLTTKYILERLEATISRITPFVVHLDKISKRV